jgi:hypothetical protein
MCNITPLHHTKPSKTNGRGSGLNWSKLHTITSLFFAVGTPRAAVVGPSFGRASSGSFHGFPYFSRLGDDVIRDGVPFVLGPEAAYHLPSQRKTKARCVTEHVAQARLCASCLAATRLGSKFTFLPQFLRHNTLGVGYLIEGTHAESAFRPGLRT